MKIGKIVRRVKVAREITSLMYLCGLIFFPQQTILEKLWENESVSKSILQLCTLGYDIAHAHLSEFIHIKLSPHYVKHS